MQAAVLAALLLAAGLEIASAGFRYVPPAETEVVQVEATAAEPAAKGSGEDIEPPPASGPTVWRVRAGEMLHEVLARWGARVGTDVLFLTDRRYRLERPAAFEGGFADAVRALMEGLSHLPRPPEGAFAADGASVTVTHRAAQPGWKGDGR